MSITNFLAQRNVTAAFPSTLPDNTVQVSAAAIIDNTTFGLYWNALSDAINRNWAGIACSANGQYITGVVTGGSIYYSNNYAVTMTASASAGTTAANWSAVAMSASGQYQIATINSGSIYYSSNYGQTWTIASGTASSAWSAIALSASGTYATAVVNGGQIWYSTNYGQTWTAIPTSAGPSSITLAWSAIAISASGQYQVAVINGGSVYYSSTFGFSWTASTTSGTTAVAWTAVAISASGQYVTAGISSAALWTSTNYGQTWTVTSLTGFLWKAIAMVSSAQYQLAVGTSSMYYSNNFGSTWTTTGGTYTIRCLAASTAGHYLFAAVYGGLVYQSVVRVPSIFSSGSIILGNALSTNNQPQIGYTQVGIGSTTNYASIGFASNANTLCWTANGNVGIGITNPSATLHVNSGTIKYGTTPPSLIDRTVSIYSPSGLPTSDTSALILCTTNAISTTNQAMLMGNYWGGTSATSFSYINATNFAVNWNALVLNSAGGNVGIGTTNPGSTLQLTSAYTTSDIWPGPTLSFHIIGGSGTYWYAGAIVGYVKANNAGTNGGTNGGYPGGLAFQTKNSDNSTSSAPTTKMVLDAAGNLGIGKTNPNRTLYVNAQTAVAATTIVAQFAAGAYSNNTGGTLIGFSQEPGAWAKVALGHVRTGGYDVGDMVFLTSSAIDTTTVTMSDERMRITSVGNVGIGTANPYSKFTVKSDYSVGITGGFCIDATDIINTYRLYLYPYIQADAKIAYQFSVSNLTTTSSSLSIGYNGNVGIGNASPGNLLSVGAAVLTGANSAGTTNLVVYGNINCYRNRLIFSDSLADWNHSIYNNTRNLDNEGVFDGMKFNVFAGAWFRVSGTPATSSALFINSSGNVGIGLTTPSYALHVSGAIYASGDITALSDQRHKQNITPLTDSLAAITQLSGYSYTRSDYKPGEKQIGLIAQEVKEVYPEAVSYDDVNDTYSLNYGCLMAPVIQAIKEMKDRIERQDLVIQQLLDSLGPQ